MMGRKIASLGAMIAGTAVGLALFVAGCVALQSYAAEQSTICDTDPGIVMCVQYRDHGGLPHCTDAIANAGGQCWGEPAE